MKKKLLYSGKAKDLYETEEEGVLLVQYKDQMTMLNGARKEEIIGKGRVTNRISSLIFERLEAAGIRTHFIKRVSETEQLTHRMDMLALEVVLRNRSAGSFSKKFGLSEGENLPQPIIEFYYKNDCLDDPFINDEHIAFLQIATQEELVAIKEETKRINQVLQELFATIGLVLVDFKLEFGRNHKGDLILADEFSPDNCRLWDEGGRHLDKDVFRKKTGNVLEVYEEVLARLEAREQ